MNDKKGKLVVIEGIDGTGKKTQATLLKRRFENLDRQCELISFPRYRHPAAYFEEVYLQPDSAYGSPDEVGPYRASVFFALDRYDASFQLKRWIDVGAIIIADRYLISNVAHQGGKIKDEKEREKYVEWLYDFEYGMFGVPRPDLNIILTLPVQVSSERVLKKQTRLYLGNKEGAKDAHEGDERHLKEAQDSYLWMAQKYPDEFAVIECVEDGRELTREEVHEKIWQEAITEILANQ